jgi:ribosomal protein S18 acetylase RimI-like enzyme
MAQQQSGLTRRVATEDDAAAIARLHIASWRVAYRGSVPDSYLDNLNEPERIDLWRQRLTEPGKTVLLVEDDAALAAFCAVSRSDDPDADASVWLVTNLHVSPERRRHGIGGPLLAEAIAIAQRAGGRRMTLWVVEDNWPARHFYEKHGMVLDGARRVKPFAPGVDVVIVRYALSIAVTR